MTPTAEKVPRVETSGRSLALGVALLIASAAAFLVAVPKLSAKRPVPGAPAAEAPAAPEAAAPVRTSHDPRRISEKGD